MPTYHFDVETYSELDLTIVGSHTYAVHPSTDVLCAAYGGVIETNGMKSITPLGWMPGMPPPQFEPGSTITGYNVIHFDRLLWKYVLFPKYGWQNPDLFVFSDTMHKVNYTNLPGTLAAASKAMRVSEKDATGHTLMLRLCKPANPTIEDSNPKRLHTPENILRLLEYCKADVQAEAELDWRLPEPPAIEKEVIRVDTIVNDRGIYIDLDLVHACMSCAEGIAQHYRDRLSTLTNGIVTKDTDVNGIADFCNSVGMEITKGKGAMDAKAVTNYLSGNISPQAREVLRIRQIMGKSSLAKLSRLLAATGSDSRLRGTLQYYGAHQTGRWAGRIIQPQNLPRQGLPDYETAMAIAKLGPEDFFMVYGEQSFDVLTALIRPCLAAAPGYELVVADYNSVECRVLAWLASEKTLLDAYAKDICAYRTMAMRVYQTEYKDVTKAQRNLGKALVLGCGYGMGGAKFKTAVSLPPYNIEMEETEAKRLVNLYRDTFTAIPVLWKECERAARMAIEHPNTGYAVAKGKLVFESDGVDLTMRLPSGVRLYYRNAKIGMIKVKWSVDPVSAVTYMCEDQNGYWAQSSCYGAKFVEHACQAISRGITARALVRCEDMGLRPVASIHDEIVCETKIGTLTPHRLEEIICMVDPWAAKIPLKAEAFSSLYYRK